ncbi:hypothetical protein KI809_00965 [Geobacter pelophilus]|uniref:Methyl-accepting transducer domain-containing protein n=1 Tax=Geoanaerobacter pelophilus TaxID=60036 RepID=A0AAW4L1K9_9BACT|nr:methyl-accepting chemotaxis protein [Geoanaerobacter pelophilus]MBT0662858.1 hypothetical protein [Geoanaerobacter pelophilus]
MTKTDSQPKTYSRSLTRRFILRLLIILLLGQCLALGWSLYTNEQIQKNDIREKISLSGKQLASLAVVSRTSFDFTYLGQLIDELIKDEDILRITYVDKGLTIIDRKGGKSAANVMKLEIPVMDAAEKVGAIAFEYTDYRVVKNVFKQAATSIAFMALLFVVLALFIYYFFNRDIGSKVIAISGTIEQMTQGDLTCRSSEVSDDEFGAISGGLDFLVKWLASTIDRYKSISISVADATELLNKTFKDLINGVNRQQLSTENAMVSVQNAIDSLEKVIESTDNLLELSDESTQALNGILTTSQGIANKMERLSRNIHSSYDSVLTITRTSQDVASSAGRANSSMAFADQAVSNINTSVTKISGFVRETTELSKQTNAIIAERGIKSVQDAYDSMQRIEQYVASLTSTMTNLGTRSKDIAKVLDVIKEVTEQTKLLSLNAQILSGQAGEHGKPFAVVASEMKSLSDKTAISTKEIEAIVSMIQGEISVAVKSTQETTKMVVDGKAVAARAGDALQSIQESSGRSSEMVTSLEKVASEQNQSLEQIIAAFGEIRKLISDVNHATKEEEQGMTALLEGFGAIRNAMDVTRSASEEQTRSIQMITENLSLANDKTRAISASANEQSQVSHELIKSMKRIIQIGAETVHGVRDVSARIVAMSSEVEALKREIKSFKTDSSA